MAGVGKTGNVPAGFKPIQSSNPFGASIGPVYERQDGEDWVRALHIRDELINRGGVAHGGLLMTFADIVGSRAVLAVLDGPFVTLHMACDFIRPAPKGAWLEGRAGVSSKTARLVHARIFMEVGGTAIFRATGTYQALRRRG